MQVAPTSFARGGVNKREVPSNEKGSWHVRDLRRSQGATSGWVLDLCMGAALARAARKCSEVFA